MYKGLNGFNYQTKLETITRYDEENNRVETVEILHIEVNCPIKDSLRVVKVLENNKFKEIKFDGVLSSVDRKDGLPKDLMVISSYQVVKTTESEK